MRRAAVRVTYVRATCGSSGCRNGSTTLAHRLQRRHVTSWRVQPRSASATVRSSGAADRHAQRSSTTSPAAAAAYTRDDTAVSLFRRAFATTCGSYASASSTRASSRVRDDDVRQLRAASFFPRLWHSRTTTTQRAASSATTDVAATVRDTAADARQQSDHDAVGRDDSKDTTSQADATTPASSSAVAHDEQRHYQHAYAVWQRESARLTRAQHELARLYAHATQRSYAARWHAVQRYYNAWYTRADLVICIVLLFVLHAILEYRTYMHVLTDIKVVDYRAYVQNAQDSSSSGGGRGKGRRRIDIK